MTGVQSCALPISSLSASEKGSQWAQALALLREMSDRRLESDVVSYSASIRSSEKGWKWRDVLWEMLDMLAGGGHTSHARHSCVLGFNLFHRLEVWDNVSEVETFHSDSSCVRLLEKLHFSHMQVREGLPTATFAGSTYDTLLSLLPGGLGSNFTRDAFPALGIACDAVSSWCMVAVDMHRTWG